MAAAPLPSDVFHSLAQLASSSLENCMGLDDPQNYLSGRSAIQLSRRSRIRRLFRRLSDQNQEVGPDQSELQDKDPFLQFDILYQDGGEYDPHLYSIKNMMIDNDDVYCSVRARNVNVVLQHANLQPNFIPRFFITEIEIRAPSVGFTCPIFEGIVFCSEETISPSNYARFDNWDCPEDLDPSNSIFFRVENPDVPCVVPLKKPFCGKFLLVKLIRAKGADGNIDVKFIGFRGFFGPKSFACGEIV